MVDLMVLISKDDAAKGVEQQLLGDPLLIIGCTSCTHSTANWGVSTTITAAEGPLPSP